MVNQRRKGGGKGKGNGDKGKGKMVCSSDTSKDIPLLSPSELEKYKVLEESLRKTLIEIKSQMHGSEESKAKEGTSEFSSSALPLPLPALKAPGNHPASSSAVQENDDEIRCVEPLRSIAPQTEKDLMIVKLMLHKQQLEKELQGWTDWAGVKAMEVAQKLSKSQAELKTLREAEKPRKGKAVQNESTMRRYSMAEQALSRFEDYKKKANVAFRMLEAEQTMLKKGLAESNLISQQSSKNLQEVNLREQEMLKQRRTLEVEISSLQGELAGLKGTSAKLQVGIEKARRRQNEFEALRQHEERQKTKLLQKAESLRRERIQLMDQAQAEEDNLRAVAEENRLKFEEQMKKLTAEISALKMAAVGESSGQGGVKRDWECVMCLTEAKSVVFLPCAHQVLCEQCNVLHENQGMKDCPVCRTPITKRIHARFAPRRTH